MSQASEILRILSQIFILTLIYYWILYTLRGTPGLEQMTAIFLGLSALYLLVTFTKLHEMSWLIEKFLYFLPVIIVVLFQGEIRRSVALFYRKMQRRTSLSALSLSPGRPDVPFLNPLIKSLLRFSESHTGALIAIEQAKPLDVHIASGKSIHAELTEDNSLLDAIFYNGNPLHDGGVIIVRGYIEAASCTFPLSENPDIRARYGMRHLAAAGLSELTDAIVLVVSEETGAIHLVQDGKMYSINTEEEIRKELEKTLSNSESQEPGGKSWLSRLFQWLFRPVHLNIFDK